MTQVTKLRNIGKVSAEWLESVGIHTKADLQEVGVVDAYRRVKIAYPDRVTLNMLWALQGAVLDIPWNLLPDDVKDDLRRQVE